MDVAAYEAHYAMERHAMRVEADTRGRDEMRASAERTLTGVRSVEFISPTAVRIGDVIRTGYAVTAEFYTVRTIDTRANDSILPHVLFNGISTVAIRATVERKVAR